MVCVCVRACLCVLDRTVLYMCIEYHVEVNMYYVSAQGVDERVINVHYYYYLCITSLICKAVRCLELVFRTGTGAL